MRRLVKCCLDIGATPSAASSGSGLMTPRCTARIYHDQERLTLFTRHCRCCSTSGRTAWWRSARPSSTRSLAPSTGSGGPRCAAAGFLLNLKWVRSPRFHGIWSCQPRTRRSWPRCARRWHASCDLQVWKRVPQSISSSAGLNFSNQGTERRISSCNRGAGGDVVACLPSQTLFVGMMQYDGDLRLPARFLVPPPAIDHVSGDTFSVRRSAFPEVRQLCHKPRIDEQ